MDNRYVQLTQLVKQPAWNKQYVFPIQAIQQSLALGVCQTMAAYPSSRQAFVEVGRLGTEVVSLFHSKIIDSYLWHLGYDLHDEHNICSRSFLRERSEAAAVRVCEAFKPAFDWSGFNAKLASGSQTVSPFDDCTAKDYMTQLGKTAGVAMADDGDNTIRDHLKKLDSYVSISPPDCMERLGFFIFKLYQYVGRYTPVEASVGTRPPRYLIDLTIDAMDYFKFQILPDKTDGPSLLDRYPRCQDPLPTL
jgi:hypothetical protein